jgi:ribose 5-phosphate isomerase RpiB
MKIALMMENSQAGKNAIILKELKAVADEKDFPVFNVGMSDENDHHLTYIHLGIMASILLNAKAVDFVVTGCGTGQGALMSLNIHPGVICGYCIDPADAFLFAQINNGNALSLPFAKGFGWGRNSMCALSLKKRSRAAKVKATRLNVKSRRSVMPVSSTR